jgi:hypothetical protein
VKPCKLPPMAQAVRAFVVEMEFPPAPESGPSSNPSYAGVILALLNYAKHLRLDATEVRVDPSVKQLADICHSAPRTIQRILEKLEKHGIISRTFRGAQLSAVYTIYKYTVLHEESGKRYFSHSRHDKHVTPRGDKHVTPEPSNRGDNYPGSEVTTQPSEVTTTPSRGDKVVVLRGKASGTNTSGVKPLGDTSENVSSVSSSDRLGSAPGTNGNAHGETTPISSAQPLDDESFFCPRCNEENSEPMPDRCCTQCLRPITGGLKAPRTPEQGRIHMINVLEAMDDAARQKFYETDLTTAEQDWIMGCGMFFADELKKVDDDQRREDLLERCGVSKDDAL